MKSINRITILLTTVFVSFAIVTSLFTLFTADVEALNILSVSISGNVTTDTTWTKANSPYILNDKIIVNEGVTLTIEPGVIVMGQTDSKLAINGRLEAIGTVSEPITFTSVLSSTPGEWQGLLIADAGSTGSAHLNHVVVEYGKFNIGVFSQDDAAIITKIENTVTQFSEGAGMSMSPYSLHLTELDNVTFNSNNKDRIVIEGPEYLSGDTTLKSQPGLEGYELEFFNQDPREFVIPSGITLTIEPGVTLFMPEDTWFTVNGHVEAIGTQSQPITLTSLTNSELGKWYAFHILDTGSVNLNHTIVQYSTYGYSIHLQDGAPPSTIQNSVIQFGDDVGMQVSGHSLHLVHLDNVTFRHNAKNRIEIYATGNAASLKGNARLTSQPGLEGYELVSSSGNIEYFTIPAGITLTVEPSVTIFMPENTGFHTEGHLEAIGTPSQPITFTSITSSVPGEWLGILLKDEGSTHLNHAVVQYASFGVAFMLQGDGTQSKIENSTIQFIDDIVMEITARSLHLVDLDNVTFDNNVRNRIDIYAGRNAGSLIDNVVLTAQPGLDGYELLSDSPGFTIPAGITVTVEPNVKIMLEGTGIRVKGYLAAVGTPTEPITFTSATNDTNQWDGIVVDGGSIELTHATIQHSQGNGLSLLDGSVSASCSTMSNNLGSGIAVAPTAQGSVQLEYNSLVSNTVAGLSNEGSGWLDARYTWWGSADGPSGNGAGSGDAVTGNVHYDPWLTEPACHDVESVNLEVAQTASSAVIPPAETLTYTITVTNHAATTATQVVLTDTLPAHVTLLAAPANCSGSTELVCDLDDLGDGEQTSFIIQVQIDVMETAVLPNTIDVFAAEPDLNPSLNHSVLTTVVQPEAPKWQIFLPMVINHNDS